MTAVEYSDAKGVTGYSSQTSGIASREHSWHSAAHASSKQHAYGASAASAHQWSSRGTPSSATVSARSDWSGRGSGSSAAGGGSSFATSAKNVMAAVSASSHEPRYDAYKQLANSAMRRY